MVNLNSLDKFNVEDAKEMLSTYNKKMWDTVVEKEILKFAKEKQLTNQELQYLRKRKMLELYHADLSGKNIAASKTGDELAKRQIARNKDTMYQINELYKITGGKVKDFGKEFDERLNKISQKQNKTSNKKAV